MSKNSFSKENLIDLVAKVAKGFYYKEETLEYEKTQNKSKISEKQYKNVSFFDNFDTGKTEKSNDYVKIESSNERKRKEFEGLTLVKRKVSTHYISPDMHAIKMLFEIFGKEVTNDVSNLNDEDLIKLKNKLAEELLDDVGKNR